MSEFVVPYLCRKALYWLEVRGNDLLGRTVIEAGLAVYNRDAFNEYGDLTSHWGLPGEPITPYDEGQAERISPRLGRFLVEYERDLAVAGVQLVLLPPVLQASSFDNQRPKIESLDSQLTQLGIAFDAPPMRYRFADKSFFNTPYHLTKAGIDQRMEMLAEDLRGVLPE